MKKLLYASIITATFICTTSALKAQCWITFDYDAAGNREKRYIGCMIREGEEQEEVLTKDPKITIYPNPTNGDLKVNLYNFESYENASLRVYDAVGRLIISNDNLTEQNDVNLRKYASGHYLIKVYIEDKVFDWNIVKE